MLGHLGFTRHPQPVDENDCAIETAYDQLTRVYGVAVGEFATFRNFVRKRAALRFGTTIDLIANGQALLLAIQQFFTEKLGAAAPSLVIDCWAAEGGGLMEFQNVAQVPGGPGYILTFYYDGVSHFDSLTGTLARR